MDLRNLKIARKKAGFKTQASFAEALGIKLGTYIPWEQGIRMPPVNTVVRIAELLDCSVDELLGREIDKDYLDSREKAIHRVFKNISEQRKELLYLIAMQLAEAEESCPSRLLPEDLGEGIGRVTQSGICGDNNDTKITNCITISGE